MRSELNAMAIDMKPSERAQRRCETLLLLTLLFLSSRDDLQRPEDFLEEASKYSIQGAGGVVWLHQRQDGYAEC